METWKPVVEYEGLYEVSDFGRIRRIGAWSTGVKPQNRIRKIPPANKYPRVKLSKNGKSKLVQVHVEVWKAFRGPIPIGWEINHEDGNKWNPCLYNLKAMTRSDNHKHAFAILGQEKMQGSRHGRHKLVESQVIEMRQLRKQGLQLKEIADKFQCSLMTVSFIVNRKTWRHI